MRKVAGHRSRGRLTRAITRPPFRDRLGHKGWLTKISHAQQHVVRHLQLEIARWPQWSRPLRIAFLSDFHTGSHSDDVARLIVEGTLGGSIDFWVSPVIGSCPASE